MRKSIFFMLFMMAVILMGCQEPSDNGDVMRSLSEIAQSITLFDEPLTTDVSLPATIDGASVSWTSINQAVFSNDGVVTRPEEDEGNASFSVEATFTRDGESYFKSYNVTVLALGPRDFEGEIDHIIAGWDFLMTPQEGQISWPSAEGGARLSFTSLSPQYLRTDGYVLQPLHRVGQVDASIEVTFEFDEYTSKRELSVPIASKEPLELVRSNTYDFTSTATEYLVDDDEITLYEMNNSMIYVNLLDFLSLVDGAIVYDDLDIVVDGAVVDITLEFEPDEDFPLDYDNYNLTLDFENNQVTVNLFGFFGGIAESTQTDFGAGLSMISYQHTVLDPVVIDLSFYRLELYRHNNQFLLPLDLANLFFTGQMYDVYFNGDRLMGFDTYQLTGDDRNTLLNRLNNSSLRDESIPMSLRLMSYHYMVFVMDHFFGLKEFYAEDTFYSYLNRLNHRFFADGQANYEAWFRTIARIDEPHTSHVSPGYYIDRREFDFFPPFGPRVSRFATNIQFTCAEGASPNEGVTFLGNNSIAMITINGFTSDTPELMKGYMNQVAAVNSVEDVVLNLACNRGGIIGSAWQVMGYMTNDPLTYYSFNVGDRSQITAQYDSEVEAPDYNWFILTSPVTFSAANLVTSMARDMGIATIIGEPSAGGASSITSHILPNGSIFFISSASVLANSSFESIEFGIPVDTEIQLFELFNERAIVSAIRD